MFKGFPSFVVVGVVVDMVARRVREGIRGVSGVRSAVVLCNVFLLSVLNVCMLCFVVIITGARSDNVMR